MKGFYVFGLSSRCAGKYIYKVSEELHAEDKFRSRTILYRIKTMKSSMSNSGTKPQDFKQGG